MGVARGDAGASAAAARTSSFRTRPPGPVGLTAARSISCSRAARRDAGDSGGSCAPRNSLRSSAVMRSPRPLRRTCVGSGSSGEPADDPVEGARADAGDRLSTGSAAAAATAASSGDASSCIGTLTGASSNGSAAAAAAGAEAGAGEAESAGPGVVVASTDEVSVAPIRAMTAPTATSSPSPAEISSRMPFSGASTSTVTLSVSSSTRISLWVTGSPGLLRQLSTVASVIDSPSTGTTTSMAMAVSVSRQWAGASGRG